MLIFEIYVKHSFVRRFTKSWSYDDEWKKDQNVRDTADFYAFVVKIWKSKSTDNAYNMKRWDIYCNILVDEANFYSGSVFLIMFVKISTV